MQLQFHDCGSAVWSSAEAHNLFTACISLACVWDLWQEAPLEEALHWSMNKVHRLHWRWWEWRPIAVHRHLPHCLRGGGGGESKRSWPVVQLERALEKELLSILIPECPKFCFGLKVQECFTEGRCLSRFSLNAN